MDISIFLAKAFGLYLIIISAALLFRPRLFQDMVKEMVENQAVMILGGIVALILGIVLVISHNLWTADWRVLVTLLSWVVFLKGIVSVLAPEFRKRMVKRVQQTSFLFIVGVVDLFLGLFLAYQGFFH